MADSLPPLTALRAFEAAARHLSFSKAAEELHVTPAAISQQIRTLEDHLGVPLFHRLNRSIALTDQAEAGLEQLQHGFEAITQAVKQIRSYEQPDKLVFWAAPTFAAKWLVPRLHQFSDQYPHINISLEADPKLIDHRREDGSLNEYLLSNGVDIAFTFGRGDYLNCRTDKILSATAVPLCSPKLIKGKKPLKRPEDLKRHTLLHDDTHYESRPGWHEWCQVAGLKNLDTERGMRFNHVALALEAAIDGYGVVLSLEQMAAPDIEAGKLVIPFGPRLPLDNAYYLVSPESLAEQHQIKIFREWLLSTLPD